MRPRFWTAALLCSGIIAASCALAQADSESDGRAILRKVDDMWRGESSAALMTMHIKTEHWERQLEMKAYSLGKDYSLVRIIRPKAEAGTGTLKVESNIWNYLPKTRRVMKIPASMMMGSWMGSHFTNDDLVRESRLEDDYNFDLETENGIHHVVLTPKENAPVVWGKIELDVQVENLVPLTEKWYDEDGQLVRTAQFEDVTEINNRLVPMTMRIIPEDKPGEFTEITYEKLKFDVPIDSSFFSIQNLKRQSW